MPKAARFSALFPVSSISSGKSDTSELVSIALFSALGLLASIVAVLFGVPIFLY